jgi:hypothetical protein
LSPSAEGAGGAGPGEKPPPFSARARAERRARAAKVGAPYLVPVALVLVVGGALWTFRREVSTLQLPVATASPATQVREALAHQTRASIPDVYGFHSGGTAALSTVRYSDVAVQAEGGRASVLAVVEAEGVVAWRAERAGLTYVGREAFQMTSCAIALWCADGQQFANLRAVLAALFRRADAVASGDAGALTRLVAERYTGAGGRETVLSRIAAAGGRPGPVAHVRAWQIRVERDRAEVGEDLEVEGAGDAGQRRGRYTLVREGERWRFSDGL